MPSAFVKAAEPFACGGAAATFASCVIHPMDLAKVNNFYSLLFYIFKKIITTLLILTFFFALDKNKLQGTNATLWTIKSRQKSPWVHHYPIQHGQK
jgi:hypothetical protein